ncbi:hypothetical protein EIN_377680, partial [Entamoeba invadens IP1]
VNPFFTLQFVTKFEPSEYFFFPSPSCYVKCGESTVYAIKGITLTNYFTSRAAYFIDSVSKRLNVKNSIYPINPISFMTQLESCYLFEAFSFVITKLISNEYEDQALFILNQLSVFTRVRAIDLLREIMESALPFGHRMVEHLKKTSGLDKSDMLVLINMVRVENPHLVALFTSSLLCSMRHDARISSTFGNKMIGMM